MAFSTYGKNQLLGAIPTTVYMSLHTADPGSTGASEASGGGYARQSLTMAAASGGSRANSNTGGQSFTGSVGPVSYFGIWDASTSGNFLFGGSLAASKTFANGDSDTIAAGAFSASLT